MAPKNSRKDKDLEAALTAARDVAYAWDIVTGAIAWSGSPAALGLADFDPLSSAVRLRALVSPEDLAGRQHRLDRHFVAGDPFDCEYRLLLPSGDAVWVEDRGTAVFEGGQPVRMLGILRPMSERKEHAIRLEQLANFDELTGLFNKSRLREAMDHLRDWSEGKAVPGAYLAVGIDNLTMVNDAFGPAAADRVIVEIGRRLDRALGLTDVIGRVGGDRFGILLSQCAEETVASVAERILATVSQSAVPTEIGPISVTVSIGSIAFPSQAQSAEDVMTRAETALAAAKRAGRDCHAPYRLSDDDRRAHRASMAVGERVQAALKQDRIVFAYQGVVDAASGAVDYYECLLRMVDEDGRILAAGEFIPAVEQLGFIRMIDRFVLEKAIDEAAANPEVRLGINVSGITASDRSWLQLARSLLRDEPGIAGRLVVEITESAALADFNEVVGFVTALRDLGCRVALDDFGTGFTSLRHLQSLAIDTIKIDGSFIRNLSQSQDDQVFLRHLLGLANAFGLATVAECVERSEDAEIVRRAGVGFMQGYFFGRPSIVRPWLGAKDDAQAATPMLSSAAS
jgi:diguanylate cyclase (GGDEF)-like protein